MKKFNIGDRVEFANDGDFQNYRGDPDPDFYDVGTVVKMASIDGGPVVRWDSDNEETYPAVTCIRHLEPEDKKRPHYDLIVAWANGAEIQLEANHQWWDVAHPSWDPAVKFRIKPKRIKRKGWVNVYPGIGIKPVYITGAFATKEAADDNADKNRLDCVEIEWFEEQKG